MAARTFRDVWSAVALHAPGAPLGLIQEWCQTAYDRLIGKRRWAFLRTSTILTTLSARSLTVGVTLGDATITSVAGFVASDAGRQIRMGASTPFYTINEVVDASTAELSQVYAGSSGSATATISDVYLAMPEDFRSFDTVSDLANQRPVIWWVGAEALEAHDPSRIMSDSRLRVLVSAGVSQALPTFGRLLYEAYPHPTAAAQYLVWYFKRMDALADDDPYLGVLATHTESVKKGALAEAAMWPGVEGRRNPYFNLGLARELKDDFERACQQLDVMDDDQFLQNLLPVDLSRLDGLWRDTSLLRSSDATLSDYY